MQSRGSAPLLTPRQAEVIALVAAGLTNREIAERLGITPATVCEHVANIRWRLGLTGRAQLAAWAIDQAWSRYAIRATARPEKWSC
jgi:DNA-binding NarL/FixJ family response regulator